MWERWPLGGDVMSYGRLGESKYNTMPLASSLIGFSWYSGVDQQRLARAADARCHRMWVVCKS